MIHLNHRTPAETTPTPSPSETTPSAPDLSFKAIVECKEGSMKAMEKVVSIGPSLDQLKIVHDYQSKCLQTLAAAKIKLASEPSDSANEALLFALEKTSNRLILDNQIIKKLSDSFSNNNGIALTEDVMGFLFASKMMYQQENDGWGRYKTALEQQTLNPPQKDLGFDFSWILLIIILIIAGSRIYRLYGNKKGSEPVEK